MKKIFVFALMAMFSLASQAQIVSSRSSHVETVPEVKEPSRNWSYLYMQYNGGAFSADGESESYDGFSFGYNINYRLTDAIPLFLETGIGMQFTLKEYDNFIISSTSYSKDKWDLVMGSFKIPLGVSYVFDIPNTPISIIPNAGADFRINFAGMMNPSNGNVKDYLDKQLGHEYMDLFKKSDWEEIGKAAYGMSTSAAADYADEAKWNRFQVSGHIGVSARFWRKLLVGFQYQFDFSEIAKDVTMNQLNATVAVCF